MTPAAKCRINFGTWLLATAFFLLAAGCGQDAANKPTPPPKPVTPQPSQLPTGDKLSGTIFVYCAVGAKEAVSELAKSFEADTGVKVEITTANSGQLLGQIELSKVGDVYVPGDTGFVATAKEKKLVVNDGRVFCYFVPTSPTWRRAGPSRPTASRSPSACGRRSSTTATRSRART